MSDSTKIQWTDASWNPTRGCSKISPGCENCYAMHHANRFKGAGLPYEGLAKNNPVNWTGKLQLIEDKLDDPIHWKRGRRIFVNSMSDLFHENIEQEWQDRIFETMERASQHEYQILTKRVEEMIEYLEYRYGDEFQPPEHILFGASIENQKTANDRLGLLSMLAPGVRTFLSVEPILELIDLGTIPDTVCWVIVGGESGPGARPCELEWIQSIVAQCRLARVSCFVKQIGSRPSIEGTEFSTNDKKGGNPEEWLEHLRVREFPEPKAVTL